MIGAAKALLGGVGAVKLAAGAAVLAVALIGGVEAERAVHRHVGGQGARPGPSSPVIAGQAASVALASFVAGSGTLPEARLGARAHAGNLSAADPGRLVPPGDRRAGGSTTGRAQPGEPEAGGGSTDSPTTPGGQGGSGSDAGSPTVPGSTTSPTVPVAAPLPTVSDPTLPQATLPDPTLPDPTLPDPTLPDPTTPPLPTDPTPPPVPTVPTLP